MITRRLEFDAEVFRRKRAQGGRRKIDRREFCTRLAAVLAAGLAEVALPNGTQIFQLRYIVGSSMYGRMKLGDVVAEVRKAGARHIDIWPEHHANHREQIEAMGRQQFAAMLKQYQVELGILTRYDLGPFGLQDEMRVAKKLGGSMVISGSRGPGNLKGQALKAAVGEFIEKMKPHVEAAEQMGVTIGIENHANSLIDSPDAIRWFAEFTPCGYLGIALAPYHLPQDPALIAKLIADVGDCLVHFYAWQYGQGCHKKLPKQQELMQLPGRGEMDFVPIIAALKKINYSGWTEVFMHPVPRGISILPTAAQVTEQINGVRKYLDLCLSSVVDRVPT
jgi:sugar phosphate isomerase/epimerase